MSKETDRRNFRHMANELAKIANELIATGNLKLAPGTYKAGEIHRIFVKNDKNYLIHECLPESIWLEDNAPVDIHTIKEVWQEPGCIKVPLYKVFYALAQYQKHAGLTGKKAHLFNIDDCRDPVGETTLTFPSKETMKKMADITRKYNVPGKKTCFISLSDGNIRGSHSEKIYVCAKKQLKEYDPFRISVCNFLPIVGSEHLSFEIGANLLSHMYGECKLRIYADNFPNGSITNPYSIRIVIENADGWTVSSDLLRYFSREQLVKYDSQFTYEDDHEVNTNEVILTPEQPDSVLSIIQETNHDTLMHQVPIQGEAISTYTCEADVFSEDTFNPITQVIERTVSPLKDHAYKSSVPNLCGRYKRRRCIRPPKAQRYIKSRNKKPFLKRKRI